MIERNGCVIFTKFGRSIKILLIGRSFTQINADNYFLELSKAFLLISGLTPKLIKRPTSISVALDYYKLCRSF
jgi:hypothetical protein